MVYYVSMQRKATENTYTPAPSAATTSNPIPEVNPRAEAQPSAEEPKPEPPKPAAAAAVPIALPVKKAAANPAPTLIKPKVEEKKDDSKVGSILKKTGRILKKPFKF
jgi:hypothetical protein